jgi:hypothetical protein
LLVHKDVYERVVKLMVQASNRDPDVHGMYIYNGMGYCTHIALSLTAGADYFGYGLLELVDELLSAVHTQVLKKKWLEAWRILDAFALFNTNMSGLWTSESSQCTLATS